MHIYGSAGDIRFPAMPARCTGRRCSRNRSYMTDRASFHASSTRGHWDLRPHRARIIEVDEDRLALWQALLGRRDEPLDETPLVHAVTSAELGAMAKLAAYSARDWRSMRGSVSGYRRDECPRRRAHPGRCERPGRLVRGRASGAALLRRDTVREAATAHGQSRRPAGPDRAAHRCSPRDQVPPRLRPRRLRRAQDRWVDYSLPEPVARPYTEFYRLAWRRQIAGQRRAKPDCLHDPARPSTCSPGT